VPQKSSLSVIIHSVMAFRNLLAVCLALAAPLAHADSCTVTAVSQLAAAKSSCATITLSNVKVPAGQTLDLTKLKSGTKVSCKAVT
jgi:polygalacturonase